MHRLYSLAIPALALGLIVGCDNADTTTAPDTAATPAGAQADAAGPADHADHEGHAAGDEAAQGSKVAVANIQPSKAATTQPANGQPTGTITFTQTGNQVKVTGEIKGLKPNTKHGFHIHEKGDLSAPDLTSAGGHYNPDGHAHGGPTTSPVHAGDLGNLEADAQGNAKYELTVDNITIDGQKNPIVGKAVIIHAKADDLKSQPTGDAGGRIGGGVIEVKK